jgi:hypothetical protein
LELVLQKANLTLQPKPKSVITTEYEYIPIWRGQELPTMELVLTAVEEISASFAGSKSDTAVQT